MRQEGLLQRIADALGQLDVQGLITTGPAVDPALIAAPPNVSVTGGCATPMSCPTAR